MRMTYRSPAARWIAAASLAACICFPFPTALAQTSPHTPGPDASAKRGGEAGQGVRIDRVCTRLFDGRGQKVLVQRPGREAGAPSASDCRTENAKPAQVPEPAKPPEVVSTEKPVTAERKPVAAAPDTKTFAITAGAAQVKAAAREHGATAPIPIRVSAGRLSATLVTSGTAVFLLQSGLWTYLLILGLPLWQHVDLLPIVDAAAATTEGIETPAAEADEERAVTHVLTALEPPPDRGGRNA